MKTVNRMAVCLEKKKIFIAVFITATLLYAMFNAMLRKPKPLWDSLDEEILSSWEVDSVNETSVTADAGVTNKFNQKIQKSDAVDSYERGISARQKNLKYGWKKRLPKVIIIGVRKCGTRALLEFLDVHPTIKCCKSEVHFFDNDVNYRRGLEWYRHEMPRSLPHQLTMEKSPAYFVTDDVPKRIYNMSKDVKLLAIVRDPTERAISDYVQVISKSNSRRPSFEKFITKDKAQKVLKTSVGAMEIGVYIRHFRKWLKYFPISQFHFVSGEELIKNPAKELQAVEKFLNIEPVIKDEFFYLNATKHFPCVSPNVGIEMKRTSGCLSESKGRPHPEIRRDIRKRLQDYYRPFNKEFYEAVGRDFNWA